MSSHYREDIVTEKLILEALRSKYGTNVEITSMESESGSDKGENFMGDLASVELMANIDNEEKKFHWIIKMMKPSSGGFDLTKILGIFEAEANCYKVSVDNINLYG